MTNRIPKIKIESDYFRKTVRNESSNPLIWRLAKEVIQNSSDAGATKLVVDVDTVNKRITFTDNGCGMEEETILDVLLSLGGSFKPTNDKAVGGFGDAKKIVFMCWDDWSIHSLDNYLEKGMLDNEPIRKVDRLEGTSISLFVGDDIDNWESIVEYYKLCCIEMQVFIHKDGVEVDIGLTFDEQIYLYKVDEFKSSIGDVRYAPNKDSSIKDKMVVRARGIALFVRNIYNSNHSFILDLKDEILVNPKSTEYPLNVIREDLRLQYKDYLDSLIKKVTMSPEDIDKINRSNRLEVVSGNGKIPTVTNYKHHVTINEVVDELKERFPSHFSR